MPWPPAAALKYHQNGFRQGEKMPRETGELLGSCGFLGVVPQLQMKIAALRGKENAGL